MLLNKLGVADWRLIEVVEIGGLGSGVVRVLTMGGGWRARLGLIEARRELVRVELLGRWIVAGLSRAKGEEGAHRSGERRRRRDREKWRWGFRV